MNYDQPRQLQDGGWHYTSAAKWLERLTVSAPHVAAMACLDKVSRVVVVPHAVHMVGLKKSRTALDCPGYESSAPITRMFTRPDLGIKDSPVNKNHAACGCDRAGCVPRDQVAVPVALHATAIRAHGHRYLHIAVSVLTAHVSCAVPITRAVRFTMTKIYAFVNTAQVAFYFTGHAPYCSAIYRGWGAG